MRAQYSWIYKKKYDYLLKRTDIQKLHLLIYYCTSGAKPILCGAIVNFLPNTFEGRGDRDRKVVWFTTTFAISAYHH